MEAHLNRLKWAPWTLDEARVWKYVRRNSTCAICGGINPWKNLEKSILCLWVVDVSKTSLIIFIAKNLNKFWEKQKSGMDEMGIVEEDSDEEESPSNGG